MRVCAPVADENAKSIFSLNLIGMVGQSLPAALTAIAEIAPTVDTYIYYIHVDTAVECVILDMYRYL